ncbi:MAG: patatin-like phospholipase family protein, partial [Gammaproteobacteria bacterium]|nr:patatin-like phospholipase family protein [Gammaproteobacteria bacterium]
MNEAIESVWQILAGTQAWPDKPALRELVDRLLAELQFGAARELLGAARQRFPEEHWLTQQLALATYKDEELVPALRFGRSLELLGEIGLREPDMRDAETLALGGAVLKRLWEYTGRIEHLHEAIAFYRAAYERNPSQDQGYGGTNAAFLLDLLAAEAEVVARRSGGLESHEAQRLREDAQALRVPILSDLVAALEQDPDLASRYWFLATLAEVCFGLGEYPEAGAWLGRLRECSQAGETRAAEWKLQTTFRQLVLLARHQNIALPPEGSSVTTWHPAWQALSALLGPDTESALSCYRGKVGLALSGGGFRASLFHLGVLARLAEVDALRSVEVLSTVSGGSIVGTHYYLELQRLIEEKSDRAITRQDYVELVRRLHADFVKGVQRNIRVRVFDSLPANLRLLFSSTYTRSKRLGELYESELYTEVADGRGDRPRRMPDVLVTPKAADGTGQVLFKPKFHNWRRRAKVPVLLLNTTSLNSGHNWFFTGSWMGEPPGLIGPEVDVNERYRRLYYHQAPTEELRAFRLGHAVAASSCVPGMFEPLVLQDLYPDRTVRLVDGGVHDNQGVAGLLDEACTLVLCSDASGQMPDAYHPGSDPAGVLL